MVNFQIVGNSLSVKRQIVEKLILKRRAQEETAIVEREMCDYMRFYSERVIPQLEREVIKYQKIIGDIPSSGMYLSNDK